MITTVTLNPCVDLTVHVPDLRAGELNLVSETRTDISGKGINVSMVLRAFGLPTLCTGINFDADGHQLTDKLEENSISGRFALAHGRLRTNVKVYDDSKEEMTELNQQGCPVEPVVIHQYLELLRECARVSSVVVFSGRIPAQADEDIYRQSIKIIRDLPCKVILDAEGKPLRKGLLQKPYLIKPNRRELETLLRRKLEDKAQVVQACREVIRRGIEVVCVSLGREGALIVDQQRAFYSPALDIPVRGLQGAGDSMVAGVCKAMREQPDDIEYMLRCGVAAASASILRPGTLLCTRADFDRLLPMVQAEPLE